MRLCSPMHVCAHIVDMTATHHREIDRERVRERDQTTADTDILQQCNSLGNHLSVNVRSLAFWSVCVFICICAYRLGCMYAIRACILNVWAFAQPPFSFRVGRRFVCASATWAAVFILHSIESRRSQLRCCVSEFSSHTAQSGEQAGRQASKQQCSSSAPK